MPSRPDSLKPILRLELRISLSAEEGIMLSIAKEDGRMKISDDECLLNVASDSPATAIVELKGFAERFRNATRGERV